MTATGSYLEGLEPFGGSSREMSVTKAGLPIFDGSPHQYEDWKAKVEAAVAGASLSKEEDRSRDLSMVGLHVFQALQGDASRAVRDKLGSRECVVPDGASKIIQVLEQEIFHRRRDLAKDLNRQGTQPYGLLSRSVGGACCCFGSGARLCVRDGRHRGGRKGCAEAMPIESRLLSV